MSDLELWLASIEDHLNTVTAEELERGYLAVKDGYGVTIEQLLGQNAD